ncbi:MAG: plasmid maintenance system killer protein [Candidatus Kapabacteria bacterium]|nr:plasmid maintenance system killer protein [Candidatus Kapabacteria bacterium]
MIKSFASQAAEDVFHGRPTRFARTVPKPIWSIAQRKLDMINASHNLLDLRIPPGNRLELLRGDRVNFHSIRINDKYRIVFRWHNSYAYDVDIVDYH